MQRGAGEVGLEAAAHDFERIIEGEPQAGAQFDGDRLFERLEAGLQGVGRMRPVGDLAAPRPPAADRGLADAVLARI